jgi:Family of unknown function (DUF5995)
MGVTPRSLVAVLTAFLVLWAPSGAAAQDPEFVNWAELLPGVTSGYEPSSEDECRSGRPRCLDTMIREMDRRLDRVAPTCHHDSIFALSYLRTTEKFKEAVFEPGFFRDPAFITHEGAVFASIYFDAFDRWHSSRRASTPPAWAIAFDAADDRDVPAAGNLLLGMNAHIQRDRPYVLAAIGLNEPEGESRKWDNDQVNVFLNRVTIPLRAEIAQRFDPSMDNTDTPTTLDEMLSFQVVAGWREIAWRNAERLVAAPTQAVRAAVAADIERYAASQAVMIRRLLAYLPTQSSAERDAWCAVHG